MSVINQMLRDLDRPELARQSLAGVVLSGAQAPSSGWMSGTARVDAPVSRRAPSDRKALWFVAVMVATGLASMPWWPDPFSLGQASATSVRPATVATVPLQAALVVNAPMPITSAIPEATHTYSSSDALALPVLLTMDEHLDHLPALLGQRLAPAAASSNLDVVRAGEAKPVASKRAPSLPSDAGNKAPLIPGEIRPEDGLKVASIPSPPLSTALQTNESRAAPVQRETSGLEMTGQAQRLWSSGSHDAAIELLRDALAVVERAAGSDVTRVPSGELIPLVRELARMELAEGQTRQVLDMLKRLEPALAGQADLWAVRANAAQRLGSHQEAIQAYQTALTLRPGESRWMLGTAVSLAVRGQTAAALELAEKARATGTVSSDVVAYLRQLGVPLKD